MKKAFILSLLCVLFLGLSEASNETSVQRLRYSSYKTYTRIVLDLTGPVEFTQGRISEPDRLYFDLKACVLSKKKKKVIPVNDGVLKTVRLAQFSQHTVRVVLDIDKLKKYSAFMLEDPNRLVIDVYSSGDGNLSKKQKKRLPTVPDKGLKRIKTIVIDAGHGGKDPGAIGPRGLEEKDITLFVGKKLGKILEARQGVKVIYTRDKDIFVPLNDRTEIANSKKADLFISIHTNASKRKTARGIETYFLNWTNNREALKVAARENKISVTKMQKIQDGLQMILQDLARNNKREESMRLAHSVQNEMVNTLKQNYSSVEDLGVKYALFYVLVGAEMPSVLAEISFISNSDEERRLSRSSYRNKIAEALARGIGAYISQSTLIVDNAGKVTAGG
jgi:N-acetylmuramoyl-L-alanine amidase